jgi:hypothetical protein
LGGVMATGAGGPTGKSLSEKRKLIWGFVKSLAQKYSAFQN